MTLYERLMKELKTARTNLETTIAQGQVEDFPSYKFKAGQVNGLVTAMDICRTTFKECDDEYISN